MTDEEMYRLYMEGVPCPEIGKQCGRTKNAVVGRIFRYREKHGLPIRPSTVREQAVIPVQEPKPEKAVKLKTAPTPAEIVSKNLTYPEVAFADTCQYPCGEKTFCGNKVDHGVYCAPHYEITQAKPRRGKGDWVLPEWRSEKATAASARR